MLYFSFQGISKIVCRRGTGKLRFQAGKLDTLLKLMPEFIMYTFKAEEYWGVPRSDLICIHRGMLN